MSSRFSISRVGVGPPDGAAAQAGDGRLRRRQRTPQVMTDRGEQRRAHPVGLGDLARLGGLLRK